MKDYKFLCNPGACGLIGCFLFVYLFVIALDADPTQLFHQSLGEWLLTIVIGLPGAAIGALVGSFLKKTFVDEEQSVKRGSKSDRNNAQIDTVVQNNPRSLSEQLIELKKLLDAGIITQEEFDLRKKKILNS